MKYIALLGRMTLLGGLVLSSIAFNSCDKNKDPEVQQVQLINVQLKQFAITSEEDKDLQKIAFSVEHSPEIGKVSNSTPIAYGKHLNKVKLTIVPEQSTSKVQVAIGDATFADWKATDVFDLPDGLTHLRIRITSGEGATTYKYEYNVQLNRYKYDPETIEWRTLSAKPSLSLAQGAYAYALESNEVPSLIISGSDTQLYRYANEGFSQTHLTDANGQVIQIKHIEAYDKSIYGLSAEGKLHRLLGTTWQPVEMDNVSIIALLGVLPPRITSEQPDITLLIDNAGKRQFAVYTEGKLKVSTLEVPSHFPQSGYRSFANSKRYIGGSLSLVASQNNAGKVERSVWYTTNGEDWSEVHHSESEGQMTANSTLYKDNLLYEFRTYQDRGLEVATSADKGQSWRINGSIALPKEASNLRNRPILIWNHIGEHTIGLLTGVSHTGANDSSIQIGTLRKDDI